MECDDLVIEYSPLFLLKSIGEGKPCFRNDNKIQVNPEEAQGYCSPDLLEHSVSPQDVFPAETRSFLILPGSAEEGSVSTQPRNNNTKQESTRILDIIKYSPKFLRKKNAKNPTKNVSPSVEEGNRDMQDELNQKFENLESPGSASPKMGFRKKLLLNVNTRDTVETETMKIVQTKPITTNSKSAISDQEIPEFGSSKGNKNWRKVKAALKRMNDSGEQLKPVLASSEDNIQGAAKLCLKLPPEQIQDDDDNEFEEDVYQRFKAFLNSSEKKFKTSWSPRLQLKNKFSFWPKGVEADGVPYKATRPVIQEENGILSSPVSFQQFPVLKSRMYPLGMRRCSAPEAVLRREAEAFSLMKRAKDVRINSQNIKHKKANHGVRQPKLYDYREHEVRQRMRLAMEKHLENLTEYCPEICSQLNSTISEEITEYLHSTDLEDEQKKTVCLVYIGAVKNDGIYAAVRCMWSPKEDHIVVADYQSHSLYAIAVVFTTSC